MYILRFLPKYWKICFSQIVTAFSKWALHKKFLATGLKDGLVT